MELELKTVINPLMRTTVWEQALSDLTTSPTRLTSQKPLLDQISTLNSSSVSIRTSGFKHLHEFWGDKSHCTHNTYPLWFLKWSLLLDLTWILVIGEPEFV